MRTLLLMAVLFITPVSDARGANPVTPLKPPAEGTIKVAFLLSEGATVIDFAGPWDVFETVMLGDDRQTAESHPFELYTVASSKAAIHTSGSHRPGMTIVPDYDFADAPLPDIVVVGAQAGGPGLSKWLQKVYGQKKIVMSVCTGAFKLAKAGLLDNRPATTHHWFFDKFANLYPNVKLERGVRYVESGPLLYTAGGELSGIDLALHIVAQYFGTDQAQATADRMEYQGTGWKSNQGVTSPIPVVHEDWHGDLGAGRTIRVHIAMKGPGFTATTDGAAFKNVATIITTNGNKVHMTFDIAGHAAAFVGEDNDADDTLTGTYIQDGKSFPLTLIKEESAPGRQRAGS